MAVLKNGVGPLGKLQTANGEKIFVNMPNKGGIGMRNVYRPSESHTDKQLEGLMRGKNVMAFYSLVKKWMPHCWEEQIHINKKTGSKYKARPVDLFKQENMQAEVPVYGMLPEEYEKGGVVVAPYKMSQGKLPTVDEITVNREKGTENREWTVGELAQAILANNPGWEEGDVLHYMEVEPKEVRGIWKAEVRFVSMPIYTDSNVPVSDLGVMARGFRAKEGLLGDRGEAKVAYCYIHAQIGEDKKIHYSTQLLKVELIQDYIDLFREPERVEKAIAGFREQAESRTKAKKAAYEEKHAGLTKADIKEAVKEAVVEALREVMREWQK